MSANRASGDVTIIDVAREAGVSYATVSRVINNKGYINPETRERVMLAVTKLGYVVNQQARSLAGGRSQVVGLVVPGVALYPPSVSTVRARPIACWSGESDFRMIRNPGNSRWIPSTRRWYRARSPDGTR